MILEVNLERLGGDHDMENVWQKHQNEKYEKEQWVEHVAVKLCYWINVVKWEVLTAFNVWGFWYLVRSITL